MIVTFLLGLQVEASAQSAPQELKNNWPGFRGKHSGVLAADMIFPVAWNLQSGENILWKMPIDKHGMSSPIVWEKRIFITGADHQSRDVYCVDADTGKLAWKHAVSALPDAPADFVPPRVLEATGYAAPTMATNGRFVAAIFATGELVCLDINGERIWTKYLGVPNNHYGHASSLICDDERLYVQYDQKDNSKLLALNIATGELVWTAEREQMSWSSPILVDNAGRAELILTDSKFVVSYDPASGERYWRVECLSGEIASSATYSDGVVFVANEGAPATAIDISQHDQEPKILWQWDGDLPDTSSAVANKKFVLLPTAFGVVSCLDAKSGDVVWEHEFDHGFNSSPVLVSDRVYMIDLAGNAYVFKLGEEFELLGESKLGEPVYATPAFVGNRIFLRGLYHLFCIGEIQR
ncbi:PQQ-like beta-propeller repeat protein [Novipirellula artificiosorum]|nr:PQQ-binding-like beta-propeller repeat protein [Novipirellula artificiosorum]